MGQSVTVERCKPTRPSGWVLAGWTCATLLILPYALLAIAWTALLLIDPRLRQANDWWAWWTVAQITLPSWLFLFASTLLAYQQRLGIDPLSTWLVVLRRRSLRSILGTAGLGFVLVMLARGQYLLLALLAGISLTVAIQVWQTRKRNQRRTSSELPDQLMEID